jgi:hypothetical protein
MDAGESLLKLVNIFDGEVSMSGPIIEWIFGESTFTCLFSCIQVFPSDFARRCLSAPESEAGGDSEAARHDNAPTPRATLNPPTPTPLLREWAKATLARRSWKDTLVAAASVSIFFWSGTLREIDTDCLQFTSPGVTIYRVICERLEAIDRVTDAIECFLEMMSEFGGEVYTSEPMNEWIFGEYMFCLFVCHTFNVFGQISPTDVSQLSGGTVTCRSLHHF